MSAVTFDRKRKKFVSMLIFTTENEMAFFPNLLSIKPRNFQEKSVKMSILDDFRAKRTKKYNI